MVDTLRIWALTDGRAGNRAQALGLAEAIARQRPATLLDRTVALPPWADRLPPGGLWLMGAQTVLRAARGAEDALAPPWPDLVIGAGRRSAPVAAALRRRHGARAVQLLSPQMTRRAFDAVVVPGHDRLRGSNVMTSLGALNRITPARVAQAADAWRDRLADLRTPRVAVMVGGSSASATFAQADQQALMQALGALSQTHGLMITPSRRTPPDMVTALRAGLGGRAYVWDGQGDNPYPAILGLAQAVLVTQDSVNMASEAASAGLPTHIFPLTRLADKFQRFHADLAAFGATRPFAGTIDTWTCPPLAEADRIAADLIARGIVPA